MFQVFCHQGITENLNVLWHKSLPVTMEEKGETGGRHSSSTQCVYIVWSYCDSFQFLYHLTYLMSFKLPFPQVSTWLNEPTHGQWAKINKPAACCLTRPCKGSEGSSAGVDQRWQKWETQSRKHISCHNWLKRCHAGVRICFFVFFGHCHSTAKPITVTKWLNSLLQWLTCIVLLIILLIRIFFYWSATNILPRCVSGTCVSDLDL